MSFFNADKGEFDGLSIEELPTPPNVKTPRYDWNYIYDVVQFTHNLLFH